MTSLAFLNTKVFVMNKLLIVMLCSLCLLSACRRKPTCDEQTCYQEERVSGPFADKRTFADKEGYDYEYQ